MEELNQTSIIEVNLRKMALCGLILMAIGISFAVIETAYFMSTYLPESSAEFACDYVSTLITGGGGSLFIYSLIVRLIHKIKSC